MTRFSQTGYSRTPRLTKGAIVAFRPPDPLPTVISLQYNPETMARDLKTRSTEGEGGAETFRLAGAPEETLKVDCIIDGTDGLEVEDEDTVEKGIHPRLAALEMLIYPRSANIIANTILLNVGTIEVLPERGPFTVFVWGKQRILPVKINGMSIAEERFDPALNPLRAKVTLDMKVLSYTDLETTHPGYAMFLTHQIVKETMALVERVDGIASVLGER